MMAKLLNILLSVGVLVGVGVLAGGTVRADTIHMKDGTVKEGEILRQNSLEVHLRMDKHGIKATQIISMQDVARIEKGAVPAGSVAPQRPVAPVKAPGVVATRPAAATQGAAARGAVAATGVAKEARFERHGFLGELVLMAMDRGPDRPERLPEDLRKLWESALSREMLGNKAETFEALLALDDAFSKVEGGIERLDGISRRVRNGETFGVWMARVHWDLITAKYVGGQFDLKDVRDSERKALIGMFKEKTGPALEPLKQYFPPVDEKTGKPKPFSPTQLQGITATNAIEVKKQAGYASAILLAQMKLEPQMPVVDRIHLGTQQQTVLRILSRASDLEPAAKALIEKAEREKRMAEERVRRGG
jgi:hypothetical protein